MMGNLNNDSTPARGCSAAKQWIATTGSNDEEETIFVAYNFV